MSSTPDPAARRNRVVSRMSAVGQLTAVVAMASAGVTAGVLAHDAQVKDLQVAQARTAVAPPPVAAPQIRLVPRPIRTILVRVPAPVRRVTARTGSVVRRTTAAPRPRVAPAPARAAQPAPRRASKPAATTSTGS